MQRKGLKGLCKGHIKMTELQQRSRKRPMQTRNHPHNLRGEDLRYCVLSSKQDILARRCSPQNLQPIEGAESHKASDPEGMLFGGKKVV